MSCATQRTFSVARLLRNETRSDGVFELEFAWSGGPPAGGQFFLIRPTRTSVFLGRAISVFAWTPGSLKFLIARRGRGTSELMELRPGETAELAGPLGNTWAEAALRFGTPKKPVALVGGGIGIAPLAFFAREPHPASFDFFAGFRSASFGLEGLAARTLVVATEDGCEGSQGRIPDYLDAAAYGAVYACGPEPMLRAVAASCRAAGTPCLLSLERRMACGVGACLGCTVRTAAGNRRCCVDGPVFDAEEVLFDE